MAVLNCQNPLHRVTENLRRMPLSDLHPQARTPSDALFHVKRGCLWTTAVENFCDPLCSNGQSDAVPKERRRPEHRPPHRSVLAVPYSSAAPSSTPKIPTIRSRSSMVANSIVILPLLEHLETAEQLYVEALAAGDDFDLELVPAADVDDVRQPGWILVRAA